MHGIWIIFQAVSRFAIKIPSTLINILIEIRKKWKIRINHRNEDEAKSPK
jgi:hypothetical protein